jgi:hypothetical protein
MALNRLRQLVERVCDNDTSLHKLWLQLPTMIATVLILPNASGSKPNASSPCPNNLTLAYEKVYHDNRPNA